MRFVKKVYKNYITVSRKNVIDTEINKLRTKSNTIIIYCDN